MARLARAVLPGVPHHITQRGNRRDPVFFEEADYRAYRDLLVAAKPKAGVSVWGWCLMPNHVHLIVAPETADGLRLFLAESHRRYTRMINTRFDWRGHLWQERYHSFPMDDAHLVAALRYIDRNPVRARLVERPEDWAWSSARARLAGAEDPLLDPVLPLGAAPDWPILLGGNEDEAANDRLRLHSRTGRPLGEDSFLERAEAALGRTLRRQRPGPKPAA